MTPSRASESCSGADLAAAAVVAASLGRFAPPDVERLERELTELERAIAADEEP
ncbi:hypothetical protein ACFVTX_17580 [Agromyces sp. NPDC058136]|uniref:hypothetical protein n=1 Tax=Agromyces sp. NPDC058136 TaxID=3346354 RepID=UPI0036DF8530